MLSAVVSARWAEATEMVAMLDYDYPNAIQHARAELRVTAIVAP